MTCIDYEYMIIDLNILLMRKKFGLIMLLDEDESIDKIIFELVL